MGYAQTQFSCEIQDIRHANLEQLICMLYRKEYYEIFRVKKRTI